jgi:tetratricopeptide (TPR) repeat protein
MAVKTEKDLPENLKASWLKALSAMQLKNYGYTIQLLQTILKTEPAFLAGRQLARKAAIARSSNKKSLLSGLSTASFSSIKVQALVKKDPAAALDAVEKILENEPYNQQANLLLRDAALALDLPETATFAYETIIEGNPKDTKTMHDLAKHLFTLQQPERAGEIYNKILAVNPSDLAAVKGAKDAAARASMQRGGWDKEETTYRELIKDKEEAVLLEQKSRVVRDEDMIERQLAELHQLIEQNPENVDHARKIAELYEQKEDYASAVQWFDYAVQLGGGADLALVRRSGELRLKQFDTALAEWENYLSGELTPEQRTEAEAQVAQLKQQRDQIELEDAKKRVERNPTDLLFRYELGEIYLRHGKAQEAIPELQKARQNPNVRTRAMNLLGQCFEQKGMLDLAAKTFADAASELVAMDSIKKEILYRLGLIHQKMGQKDKYLECMKQIYETDYGYRDVAARVEGSYSE